MITELRCKKCNKKLAGGLKGSVQIVCPRCGTYNSFAEILDKKIEV